ncbi:hypothetical protein BTA51_26505 [Hahella sp. CCB-MM4]|uniref:FGGY-family carbohydrate kinase n=1 Tax=Hahella sp. (strain CCB-MM4) TaxID=1926491 RepID=UPI000BDBBF03|nr:FGGY-family carbohydrate kinase [Hahella sp. CCB-MM4]OZG70394.1 hypothetical protein BTA51_26505 [Hahella sp. CCB-MM4]
MAEYILGIDCGNTAVKAAVFDREGRQLGSRATRVETRFPQPGHSESDMYGLWNKTVGVVQGVLTELSIHTDQIKAVGVSGHGNGAYLLDHKDKPLLGIQSLDNRADELIQEFQKSDSYQQIRELNRQGLWPSQTAALLMWLKRHTPEVYSNIGRVLFCKDYINFCLTGKCSTDYGDLSASGLFDFTRNEVSQPLLKLLNLEEITHKVAPPVQSEDVVGVVTGEAAGLTGLKPGTPVVAGLFDVISSALGSGVWDVSEASIITGTWSINQVVTRDLPSDELFMSSVFPGGRYLAMENSATSASNLEWFVREFFQTEQQVAETLNQKVFDYCNAMVEKVDITEQLPLFHPYLYGSSDSATAGASFFGLSGWHRKADLLYAVYEGIVFGHLEHLLKLRKAGIDVDLARLSGGGARSAFWSQLFADVLEIDIWVNRCNECGTKGAAMAAATAAGFYPNFARAVAEMSGDYQVFSPDPKKRDILGRRFKRYQVISELINKGL